MGIEAHKNKSWVDMPQLARTVSQKPQLQKPGSKVRVSRDCLRTPDFGGLGHCAHFGKC